MFLLALQLFFTSLQSDDQRNELVVQQINASKLVVTGLQSNDHQNEMVVQQNPSQPVSELGTTVNNEDEGLFSPPCIDGY